MQKRMHGHAQDAMQTIDAFMEVLEQEIEEIRQARYEYDQGNLPLAQMHAKLRAFDAAYRQHRRLIERIEKLIEKMEHE